MTENNDGAIVSLHAKEVSAGRGAFEQRIMRAVGGAAERSSWAGCRRLGYFLGQLFFGVARRRRELAIANVQMALGVGRAQARRIARRSSINWGMTTCEFMHLPGASAQEIRDHMPLDGLEHLLTALQGGHGAIVMTAHFGNWELLLARLAMECEATAIVRPLSNRAVTEHMTKVRNGVGAQVISKHAAARPALKVLKSGRTLIIVPDRYAGPSGDLLPFFGRPTRFENAPARLAQISQAPIVPAFGIRQGNWLTSNRIEGRILPAYTVRAPERAERGAASTEGTRQVIASIEDMVREEPDQWTWTLRRWRDGD